MQQRQRGYLFWIDCTWNFKSTTEQQQTCPTTSAQIQVAKIRNNSSDEMLFLSIVRKW